MVKTRGVGSRLGRLTSVVGHPRSQLSLVRAALAKFLAAFRKRQAGNARALASWKQLDRSERACRPRPVLVSEVDEKRVVRVVGAIRLLCQHLSCKIPLGVSLLGTVGCYSLTDSEAVHMPGPKVAGEVWAVKKVVKRRVVSEALPYLMEARRHADDLVEVLKLLDVGHRRLYKAQRARRMTMGSQSRWQYYDSPGITMPHIDEDAEDVAMQTYFYFASGTIILVMWHETELPVSALQSDSACLSSDAAMKAWVALMVTAPSLTVIEVHAGQFVHMPAGIVHAVITVSACTKLSWHLY